MNKTYKNLECIITQGKIEGSSVGGGVWSTGAEHKTDLEWSLTLFPMGSGQPLFPMRGDNIAPPV